ncbi:hypothetical protein ACA351_06660 [Orientia tsutsugamushi]|uniref:hypothetical protein n=1 Tax=Orientia tsutsugamushi TaxID=784 RepID=UPI0035283521
MIIVVKKLRRVFGAKNPKYNQFLGKYHENIRFSSKYRYKTKWNSAITCYKHSVNGYSHLQ